MAFDGSGNFIALSLPDFPAIGGQPIYASQFNNVINDLMGGMSSLLQRNGESSMTGTLEMAGNKISHVGAPEFPGDVLVFGQDATFDDLTLDTLAATTGVFSGAVTAPSFHGALVGNADSATAVPWTGVGGRPTNLSQFTNDLSAAVSSFNTRSGAVTLLPADLVSLVPYSIVLGDGSTDNTAAVVSGQRGRAAPIYFLGVSVITSALTLTVPIVDKLAQIFTPGSLITIDNGCPIRPEWFGSAVGNIMRAVNAAPTAGAVILLADKRYPPSYNTADTATVAGVDYLAKSNITLQGTRLPTIKSDFTGLENGTIIDGPFYLQAAGFKLDKVGIDSGSAVCTSRYGGTGKDGFAHVNIGQSLTSAYSAGLTIGTLIAICAAPTTVAHACLLEHIDGLSFDSIETCHGVHGFVIKSKNVIGNIVRARRHTWEDVIIKSDTFALVQNVQIGQLQIGEPTGSPVAGDGLQIYAYSAGMASVTLETVHIWNKATHGVYLVAASGQVISNVEIGFLLTDHCDSGVTFNGDVRACEIDSSALNNGSYGVAVGAEVNNRDNRFGRVSIQNMSVAGFQVNGAMQVESAYLENVPYGFFYGATSAAIKLGEWTGYSFGVAAFGFSAGTLTVANGWVNFGGGNDTYGVELRGGKVRFTGLIKSGAGAVLTLPAVWRPPLDLRLPGIAFDGTNYRAIEVLISTGGSVTISNAALTGGSSYNSLQGVEFTLPY